MEIYFQFQKQQVIFSNFCKNFEKKTFFSSVFGKNIPFFKQKSPDKKSGKKDFFPERKYIFYIPEEKRAS